METVLQSVKRICDGKDVPLPIALATIEAATELRRSTGVKWLIYVEGPTIVIGPIRGHARDFAHYLRTNILTDNTLHNVVLLGNYIDGAHSSLSVLYLVALLITELHSLNIIPLIGRHELLYPILPDSFGCLRREIELRAIHACLHESHAHHAHGTSTGNCINSSEANNNNYYADSAINVESYLADINLIELSSNVTYQRIINEAETIIKAFFSTLSVGCVVNNKFFCVAGGPASQFRFLHELNACKVQIQKNNKSCNATTTTTTTTATTSVNTRSVSNANTNINNLEQILNTQEQLQEFVLNEPMDEDEERLNGKSAFVGSPSTDALCYTFNAACNFITRNALAAMIVGMEYYIQRPEYDSYAKVNHYKESVYFPGYIFSRIHPITQIAAVLSIFSAPQFCDVNRNNACIVKITEDTMELIKLTTCPRRSLTMPGKYNHAFSWSQPTLERAINTIAREVMFAPLDHVRICNINNNTNMDESSVVKTNDLYADKANVPESMTEYHEDEWFFNGKTEELSRYINAKQEMMTKMRTLCKLLQSHHLPLPSLPDMNQVKSSDKVEHRNNNNISIKNRMSRHLQ